MQMRCASLREKHGVDTVGKRGFKRGFFVSPHPPQTMKNGFFGFRIVSYQTTCESTWLLGYGGKVVETIGYNGEEGASYTRGLQYEILGADVMS